MGENNSKGNNWQRIDSPNIQAAYTTQYQKSRQPNQKVGKRPTSYQSEWPSSKSLQTINGWRGCEEKGMLLHCWWECKLIQPLWKTVWRFLKKLGIKPLYDPVTPLLGIYPEETKIEKDTCIPLFIAALYTIDRTWKQPRGPSTDEWIKKL